MPNHNQNQYQHYVPRFYLSGWQTCVGHLPKRIWVYQKDSSPFHAAIKNVGGSDNFYGIENNDGTTDIETVEKLLAASESRMGQIILKIKNGDDLTQSDRRHFSEFLSILARRTPFAKAKSEEMIPSLLPGIIDPLLSRANGIEDSTRRRRAIENVNQAASNAITRASSLASAVLLQPFHLSPIIEQMDWAFFHSPNVPLVTSDNPFVYSVGLGIGDHENGHIIFPVTKDISFQARNSSNFNSDHYNISDDNARAINLRIIGHAYHQVYASERSLELNQIVQSDMGNDLKSGEDSISD